MRWTITGSPFLPVSSFARKSLRRYREDINEDDTMSATHGRPKGTFYDRYMPELADMIFASGNLMSINEAIYERFPPDFKFVSATRESAEKRIRKRWKDEHEALLAAAAKRAQDRKIADLRAKVDQALLQDAMKLRELATGKPPYSDLFAMQHVYFIDRATPEDYKRNPMVPLVMSFGQFQVAHQRRAVLAKLNGGKAA